MELVSKVHHYEDLIFFCGCRCRCSPPCANIGASQPEQDVDIYNRGSPTQNSDVGPKIYRRDNTLVTYIRSAAAIIQNAADEARCNSYCIYYSLPQLVLTSCVTGRVTHAASDGAHIFTGSVMIVLAGVHPQTHQRMPEQITPPNHVVSGKMSV